MFIDPETGHEISVVELSSSIKRIEESVSNIRGLRLLYVTGVRIIWLITVMKIY